MAGDPLNFAPNLLYLSLQPGSVDGENRCETTWNLQISLLIRSILSITNRADSAAVLISALNENAKFGHGQTIWAGSVATVQVQWRTQTIWLVATQPLESLPVGRSIDRQTSLYSRWRLTSGFLWVCFVLELHGNRQDYSVAKLKFFLWWCSVKRLI